MTGDILVRNIDFELLYEQRKAVLSCCFSNTLIPTDVIEGIDVYKRQKKGWLIDNFWGQHCSESNSHCAAEFVFNELSKARMSTCLLYTSRCV